MAFPRVLLVSALILSLGGLVSAESALGVFGGVGIEEKLGSFVPLDTVFTGEDGRQVRLRELVHTPTLLALVYYRCPNACDSLLIGMADAVRLLSAAPGRDYALLCISIDERETPADALKAKRIALESIQGPFPPEAWRFLTGGPDSIRAVADAVGFRFRRNGDEFDHPLGLVVLSPAGKVTRYMTGTDFLPVDLSMSILEASAGRVGPTIAKVLRFCFSYDPQNHRYVFNTLKVSAILIALMVLGFGLYLGLSGRRRQTAKGGRP